MLCIIQEAIMVPLEKKLELLAELAGEFNRHNLVWAVGASVLLYFKGCVEDFYDLDILVQHSDAEKMEEILSRYGELQPSTAKNFATKYFREFIVQDVEIDMIGGFAIVKDGHIYDCELDSSQVTDYARVNGEKIPLHSLELWKKYYYLMGRTAKAAMIDSFLAANQ